MTSLDFLMPTRLTFKAYLSGPTSNEAWTNGHEYNDF